MLSDILRQRAGVILGEQKVKILDGCAARADIDDDGLEELLVRLNTLKVGNKTINLTLGKKPKNSFAYVNRDGRWQNILTAWDCQGFRLPCKGEKGHVTLELEPHNRGYEETAFYDLTALKAATSTATH